MIIIITLSFVSEAEDERRFFVLAELCDRLIGSIRRWEKKMELAYIFSCPEQILHSYE